MHLSDTEHLYCCVQRSAFRFKGLMWKQIKPEGAICYRLKLELCRIQPPRTCLSIKTAGWQIPNRWLSERWYFYAYLLNTVLKVVKLGELPQLLFIQSQETD